MMNIPQVGRAVLAHVQRADPAYRMAVTEVDGVKVERISFPPVWEAVIQRDARTTRQLGMAQATEAQGTGPWSILQLYVYGGLRLTAFFRADDILVNLFYPGEWERIFCILGSVGCQRIEPQGHGPNWGRACQSGA